MPSPETAEGSHAVRDTRRTAPSNPIRTSTRARTRTRAHANRTRARAQVMLRPDGSLFHIDFGFILGEEPVKAVAEGTK